MDMGIKGRVALVCGASSGLGYAVARGLAAEGTRVAICARNQDKLNEANERIRKETNGEVLPFQLDVSDPAAVREQVQKVADHFGKLEILVPNAGGPPPGNFMDHSEETWKKALDLNLLSTVNLCHAAVPHMQKANWGRIVNITSFAAKQPHTGLILSNASRAGVLGLSKSLANELAGDSILVNSVCPGAFETERHRFLSRKRAEIEGISVEQLLKKRTQEIPMGRFGRPEEFADLVVFLASERASYITGTAIQIDGGVVRGII